MKQESSTLNEAFRSLRSTIYHAYKLAPAVVILGLLLFFLLISLSFWFSGLIMAQVVVLVLVPPLIIYIKTDNYAESIFTLVAGLLTAFTVNWTWNNFSLFLLVWVSFSLLAVLIWSIKMAAKDQVIYREAAIYIDVFRSYDIEKQLRNMADSVTGGTLGPIEKANAIRIMAFRKIPIDSMKYMLEWVQILTTLANLDAKSITLFLIDLSKALDLKPGPGYSGQIDKILDIYRGTPVSLEEFIQSFMNTRRLIISGELDSVNYLKLLRLGLERGFSPEEIYDYIQKTISLKAEIPQEK